MQSLPYTWRNPWLNGISSNVATMPSIMMVPSMMREARYPTARASSRFLSKGNANTAMKTSPMLLIDHSSEPNSTAPLFGKNPGQIVGGVQNRIQDGKPEETGDRAHQKKGCNQDF